MHVRPAILHMWFSRPEPTGVLPFSQPSLPPTPLNLVFNPYLIFTWRSSWLPYHYPSNFVSYSMSAPSGVRQWHSLQSLRILPTGVLSPCVVFSINYSYRSLFDGPLMPFAILAYSVLHRPFKYFFTLFFFICQILQISQSSGGESVKFLNEFAFFPCPISLRIGIRFEKIVATYRA